MYLKRNTLLLADVFKNFRKNFKKYYLYPVKVLSTPSLAWQAALEKPIVKLELLTDIDRHSIYRYARANNKYMKDYD